MIGQPGELIKDLQSIMTHSSKTLIGRPANMGWPSDAVSRAFSRPTTSRWDGAHNDWTLDGIDSRLMRKLLCVSR